MKKYIILAFFALIYTSSYGGSQQTNLQASPNDIYFYPMPEKYGQKINPKYKNPNIQYSNFNLITYKSPSNGNWGGIVNPRNIGNGFALTALVDRHGTEEVASWFNGSTGESGANINPEINSTFGHTADLLNFAFRGDLSFISKSDAKLNSATYTCNNVVIAQGHAGFSNNWWFAGDKCRWLGKVNIGPFKHSSDSVMCTCQKQIPGKSTKTPAPVVFVRGTNGIAQSDHEIWIYTGPYIPSKVNY